MNDHKNEANEANGEAAQGAQKASGAPLHDGANVPRQTRAVHAESEARGPETRAKVIALAGLSAVGREVAINEAYRLIRDAGGYVSCREFQDDALYVTYVVPGAPPPAPDLPGMAAFTAEEIAIAKIDGFLRDLRPGFAEPLFARVGPAAALTYANLLRTEADTLAAMGRASIEEAGFSRAIEVGATALNALFSYLGGLSAARGAAP